MSKKTVSDKDIQQARWEEKWNLLPELIDSWTAKSTQSSDDLDFFRCMVNGESVLETVQSEKDSFSTDGQDYVDNDKLSKAYGHLSKALKYCDELPKEKYNANTTELHLLLVKYHFLSCEFSKSLQFLESSQVTRENVEELTRRGRLLASEAFCLKGQALDIVAKDSTCRNDEEIMQAYKTSADISLWIFTEELRSMSFRKTTEVVQEKFLPKSLYRTFIKPAEFELRRGNVHEAIDHYRSILRVVESKGTAALRKVLALQLAEILLFGVCESNYSSPPIMAWQNESRKQNETLPINTYQQRASSVSSTSGKSTPKPSHKDYGRSRSSSKESTSFCPKDEFEEALLLLLISESLLLRDGCVSLFEEDKQRRKDTIDETGTIYDLLCIALTRRQQHGFFLEELRSNCLLLSNEYSTIAMPSARLLSNCIERGIKLAYYQFDIWFQYGLALLCDRKYKKALIVLKKCHELHPDDVQVLLHCMKICINHLRQYEEAVMYAEKALEETTDILAKANCLFALGISYSLMASKAPDNHEGTLLRKKSIQALEKAHDLDPDDADILCQLSLNFSLSRELTTAASLVNQALQMDPFHRDSLLLLSLILSAQSRHQDALEILEVALREFPEDFNLLQAKVSLTVECYSGEQALNVCQEMLRLWNEIYGEEIGEANASQQEGDGKSAKSSTLKKSALDVRSIDGGASKSAKSLSFVEGVKPPQDEDEVSSITASVTLERSLSEVASFSVSGAKLRAPAAIALLAKLWLITADVYLDMENLEEVSNCLLEASAIFPVSPEVLCMRGRLNYMQKNIDEAKACFDSALAVAPKHIESMEQIASLHYENGSNAMAQKYIRDAIAIEPAKPSLWHSLGIVMASRGEHEEASECFLTALDLEATTPILPFTLIPRNFKEGDV